MSTLLNILEDLKSNELQIGVIALFDNGDGKWDIDNVLEELRQSFCANDDARIVWLTENKFNIVQVNNDDTSGQVIYYGEVSPTTADLSA